MSDRGLFEWFNLLWETGDLSHNARLVGSYLWKRADYEDGIHTAWPTKKELQDRCDRAEATINAALEELKRLGWIDQTKRSYPGGGYSYRYTLRIPGRHHPDVREAPPDDIEEARNFIAQEHAQQLQDLEHDWERERLIDRHLPEIVPMVGDL